MTEAELRNKHAIRVAWSNSTGTLDQLLYGAFYNAPGIEVLADFASVMGLKALTDKWAEMSQPVYLESDDTLNRQKPYIDEILRRLQNGETSPTPEYYEALAQIARGNITRKFLSDRWNRNCLVH
jgi:hypothetical protein